MKLKDKIRSICCGTSLTNEDIEELLPIIIPLIIHTDYKIVKDKVEIKDEGDFIRITGQFTLYDPSDKSKENEILGIATEDIKKGQIAKLELK